MENKRKRMIVTTTPSVEGQAVEAYLGIVSGEAVMGANLFKDMFAVHEMQENAQHLGANAVLSVDLDYETIGANGSMLMVSASGTALRLG